MNCYWQQTDKTRTIKQKRIAKSSKENYSEKNTEKLVASKITKFLYQNKLLMKYFGTCTKSLENILDLQKKSSHTDRNNTTQTWQNQPKSASAICCVSNALENHGPITNAPVYPCKTIVNTHGTRRRHASWLGLWTTSIRWLSKQRYSHGCIWKISVCLP